MVKNSVDNAKFIIGCLILIGMIVIHAFFSPFVGYELLLFSLPAHLIGMDIAKIIKLIKGSK